MGERGKKPTPPVIRDALHYLGSGKSVSFVARTLGITRNTVRRIRDKTYAPLKPWMPPQWAETHRARPTPRVTQEFWKHERRINITDWSK